MTKKRFRVRPYRADKGYQFWAGGPDTGRTAPLRSTHLGQTAGEVIDALLKRRTAPAVEIGTGGRGTLHYRKHKKPSYPEH